VWGFYRGGPPPPGRAGPEMETPPPALFCLGVIRAGPPPPDDAETERGCQ